MQYPPAVALINVIVKAKSRGGAMRDATTLSALATAGGRSFAVLGPAPAPLGRLRGEHRAQFFLKGTPRGDAPGAARALATAPELRRRTIVDVDPMTML